MAPVRYRESWRAVYKFPEDPKNPALGARGDENNKITLKTRLWELEETNLFNF